MSTLPELCVALVKKSFDSDSANDILQQIYNHKNYDPSWPKSICAYNWRQVFKLNLKEYQVSSCCCGIYCDGVILLASDTTCAIALQPENVFSKFGIFKVEFLNNPKTPGETILQVINKEHKYKKKQKNIYIFFLLDDFQASYSR